MSKQKTEKKLTPTEIAHKKFLKKMGVTKQQLKERKEARKAEADGVRQFNPDTWATIRAAYD